jgi:hypothetical protein
MTKRLEEAIDLVRSLPEDEQDRAADLVFVYLSSDEWKASLDENEPALIQS